jgi:hypothetical protein
VQILEYIDFDPTYVEAELAKVRAALARDDLRSADVKKLAGGSRLPLYRAKLNDADRLILTFVRYGGRTCALLLEVVRGHAYEKSRFLRGAPLDESRIAPTGLPEAEADALALRYLHPRRPRLHILDKPLSFDDAQQGVYELPSPLVLVGSAGSGKTALTLERLKGVAGDVAYVTRSEYLAQSAREMYFALGYERNDQEPAFLSLRAFVETWHVPPGRAVDFRAFADWFARHRQNYRQFDAHALFEEFGGVLCSEPEGALSRETYLALGARQSLFADAERDAVYTLFERFRAWLGEAGLYEPSLLAHEWAARVVPRYDFVVVDEVQDFTLAQLALVLRSLRRPGQFLLTGDANQIVHPNFFAWSRVKSLLWRDEELSRRHRLHVLAANFRNSAEATAVANRLLRIKQRRFGSIDRESNFLVQAVGANHGTVELVRDSAGVLRALDERSRSSARVAVLVLRDEDKPAARERFRTPLLFSVREAKGLEYDSVVLYRFVSGARADYAEVAAGVSAAGLAAEEGDDELEYRRARDKRDKTLDRYKFFVNALYVALTRAVTNVVWVEADVEHPLLGLLGLAVETETPRLAAQRSSLEEWQREARRLELQGKQEQADAIRAGILHESAVPWPVWDEARLRETLARVLRDRVPGEKPRQQLLEVAACHHDLGLAHWLAHGVGYVGARNALALFAGLRRKYLAPYAASNLKEVLSLVNRHGTEYRTPMNQTPLMAAAAAGNLALVDALLERGADPDALDHTGRGALHWALAAAFDDVAFAGGSFAAVYERVAPPCTDLKVDERLVRLERHHSEYLLWHTLIALFKTGFGDAKWRNPGGFDTAAVLKAWQHMPPSVVRASRNTRQHLSNVLSRNESARDYAYNRMLFVRVRTGFYQLNPALRVRRVGKDGETWVPIYAALNLPLVRETALPRFWPRIDAWLVQSGIEVQAPLARGLYDTLRTKDDRAAMGNPLHPIWEWRVAPEPTSPGADRGTG